MRLVLHDGGLDGFVPQLAVVTGAGLFYLDLGDPVLMVAAEYDGSSHVTMNRLAADRRRHNALEGAGWRMRYFTRDDLYRTPAAIVPTLLRAAAHPPPPP